MGLVIRTGVTEHAALVDRREGHVPVFHQHVSANDLHTANLFIAVEVVVDFPTVWPPRRFAEHYPGAHLSIQTLGANALREGLLHGHFDSVVNTMAITTPELDATVLHRDHAVCVMHPHHSLASCSEIHVRGLQDQLLLTLNADDNIFLQLLQTMQKFGIQAGSTIETTYSSTICRLAAQGVGVVNPYIASVFKKDLCVLPLDAAVHRGSGIGLSNPILAFGTGRLFRGAATRAFGCDGARQLTHNAPFPYGLPPSTING